jgi:D-lactate dehydrogenase
MSALPERVLIALRAALPRDALLTAHGDCLTYAYDNSAHQAMPQAVVLPTTAQQVQAVMHACRADGVPLVARGRGTNTTGASVPVQGGVVMSFERMNRVLRIDTDNRYAVVEPGLLNGELQQALRALGFFWAPDPTSADFCTVGGNLACNAAGPRAVKYGSCRENVLGLRAIAGTGEAIRTGSLTTKGAVGYDLTRLLIGSEGTLALITEATLKLTPLPQAVATLRARYDSVRTAAQAVARIMAQPVIPCALEFMDAQALRLAREIGGARVDAAGAMLMIEVDGPRHALDEAADAVTAAAGVDGLLSIERARNADDVAALWSARKALSPALRHIAPKKINEDVVVPVSRLPELIDGLQRIAATSGIPIVNFGHAGNGNVHVNLLYRPEDPAQATAAPGALSDVFDLVIALDGTLSGEHGIGVEKRPFVARAIDAATLKLMRAIKQQFDPAGILNPGKLLPD